MVRNSFVKGVVVERVELGQRGSERDVNLDIRSAAMVNGEPCQESIDAKAFTGRGSRPELRHLEVELDRLERHMIELAEASKKVHGCHIYLALHHKTHNGYTFLRWRESGGAKRHLPWNEARDEYATYQPRTGAWYAQLSEQAMKANAEHLRLRKAAKAIRTRLKHTQMATYAKPVPPGDGACDGR